MGLVFKNGNVVGSANITTTIGGVIVTGIKSVNFKFGRKKENVQGFQAQPIGRGRGAYTYDALTLEILLEEYKAICAAAPNNDPTQISAFNIPIVYDGNILPPEILNNVEFTDSTYNPKAGDMAIWITVECIFAGINQ